MVEHTHFPAISVVTGRDFPAVSAVSGRGGICGCLLGFFALTFPAWECKKCPSRDQNGRDYPTVSVVFGRDFPAIAFLAWEILKNSGIDSRIFSGGKLKQKRLFSLRIFICLLISQTTNRKRENTEKWEGRGDS